MFNICEVGDVVRFVSMNIGEPKLLYQWYSEYNQWQVKPKRLTLRELANRFKIIRAMNKFDVYYNKYDKCYKFDKRCIENE